VLTCVCCTGVSSSLPNEPSTLVDAAVHIDTPPTVVQEENSDSDSLKSTPIGAVLFLLTHRALLLTVSCLVFLLSLFSLLDAWNVCCLWSRTFSMKVGPFRSRRWPSRRNCQRTGHMKASSQPLFFLEVLPMIAFGTQTFSRPRSTQGVHHIMQRQGPLPLLRKSPPMSSEPFFFLFRSAGLVRSSKKKSFILLNLLQFLSRLYCLFCMSK
jgi:hypothetical protein